MNPPHAKSLSSADDPDRARTRDNVVGILAMLAAMAGFIASDSCAKLLSEDMPLGEILVLRNTVIATMAITIAYASGALSKVRRLLTRPVAMRTVGEVGSAPLYLLAVFHLPIANVTAIAQMLPLILTVAAATLFGERVRAGRWLAAVVGLVGVLLVIQPGTSAFSLWTLVAVAATGFIAIRDIATRRVDAGVPTILIAGLTSIVVLLFGLALLPFETWAPPTERHLMLLAISAVCLLVAYLGITIAMRVGELSLTGLFRYSIVLWAMISGYLLWGEWPNEAALWGLGLVVATGSYTVLRERRASGRLKTVERSV